MWIFWVLVANAGIFWVEHAYRSAKYGNFFLALPYIALPVIVSQAGLFYAFRQAPSLFLCGAVFTLVNVALRTINAYRLGEAPNIYNWAGIALLCISVILLKIR